MSAMPGIFSFGVYGRFLTDLLNMYEPSECQCWCHRRNNYEENLAQAQRPAARPKKSGDGKAKKEKERKRMELAEKAKAMFKWLDPNEDAEDDQQPLLKVAKAN